MSVRQLNDFHKSIRLTTLLEELAIMLSTCICAALSGCVAASTASGGPIVDLGYGLWQSTINVSYWRTSNCSKANNIIDYRELLQL